MVLCVYMHICIHCVVICMRIAAGRQRFVMCMCVYKYISLDRSTDRQI